MSQYLNFFAKSVHGKEFIPIADYSRNTKVYQETEAPYEKIRVFKEQELRDIAERLRAGKIFANSQINSFNRRIDLITQMDNPLDEKLEAINEYLGYIDEYKDEIDALDRWATEIDFIANMTDYCDIYAGFEVGEPTNENITS